MSKNNFKTMMIIGASVAILSLIIFSVQGLNKTRGSATGNTIHTQQNQVTAGQKDSDNYQDVTLSANGLDYIMTPNTLQKGVPVRMTVDLETVGGCGRSVTIPAFGIGKNVQEGDNIILFTPTRTGTITIACSMNMFVGQFTVVDGDSGQGSTNVVAAKGTITEQIQSVTTSQPEQNAQKNQRDGMMCGAGAGGGAGTDGCECGVR